MKISLRKKISILVTIIIIATSFIITYIFISIYENNIKKEFIERGKTLSHLLSKSAEEGLLKEDLDMLKQATYIINAKDINNAQIYTYMWDIIESSPHSKFSEQPNPEAIKHFESSTESFYVRSKGMHDFYSPILFKLSDKTQPMVIGFAKVCLSDSNMHIEINKMKIISILISMFFTTLAIVLTNIIINRSIINPVMGLHKSISKLKDGILYDSDSVKYSDDEIGELARAFHEMSIAVKNREDRLAESEKRIKSLFERVEHAIFRLDKEGNIIETNRKFNEMFGKVEKLCDIFIGEKKISDYINDCIVAKSTQIEERAVGRDGKELFVLLSLYPDADNAGNLKGFDGYMIDMTEKKKLQESLFHARKMEAMGTLAGGIAHDFNNILQGILGYTSLLKVKIPENDPIFKSIDVIERSAQRAAELIKQLLGFARGGRYAVKVVSLKEIVNDVFQIISETFDRAIEIRTDLADNTWFIEADKSQIENVLMNLCINARDAMPDRGILQIQTFNYEGRPLPMANDTKWSVLKVTDTGMGIDEKIKDHIFEPFFTTKEKGIGMGLAMVYGVIKNHGGFITVDTEVGKGTSFTIYLPATDKKPDIIDINDIIDIKKEKVHPCETQILIIDDEDVVRNCVKNILEEIGYKVIVASNGQEGIDIYKERKDEISLVILDIIMPKMSGKVTFEKLKHIDPDICVLISSGYSIDRTAMEILNAGAKDFIQKPYNLNELVNKINKLCTMK